MPTLISEPHFHRQRYSARFSLNNCLNKPHTNIFLPVWCLGLRYICRIRENSNTSSEKTLSRLTLSNIYDCLFSDTKRLLFRSNRVRIFMIYTGSRGSHIQQSYTRNATYITLSSLAWRLLIQFAFNVCIFTMSPQKQIFSWYQFNFASFSKNIIDFTPRLLIQFKR